MTLQSTDSPGPVLQLLAQRFAAGNTSAVVHDLASIVTPALRFVPGHTALVLDSPHSGHCYPDDFHHSCTRHLLRQAEDTHVESLYDFAPDLGVAWLEALFPRSYLDANRSTLEIDPGMLESPWPGNIQSGVAAAGKVRLGKGLLWRCTDDGTPIYDRLLTVAEVQARIARCWVPYHAALKQAIDSAHAAFGYCLHLNCHSMPSVASVYSTDFPGLVHPDFVVGDRDGSTADARLSQRVCEYLRAKGYSVAYNHPYKGVELVRSMGNPSAQRHSMQLEINRRLYMDEGTLERNAGFSGLQQTLKSLVSWLLTIDPRQPC
ncbi:MAG: N-formylglutamate amidohydrolase [Polaromonas sp.]|nr:N-formylglutamate amidohydrolase [Polaromonas sp.]